MFRPVIYVVKCINYEASGDKPVEIFFVGMCEDVLQESAGIIIAEECRPCAWNGKELIHDAKHLTNTFGAVAFSPSNWVSASILEGLNAIYVRCSKPMVLVSALCWCRKIRASEWVRIKGNRVSHIFILGLPACNGLFHSINTPKHTSDTRM